MSASMPIKATYRVSFIVYLLLGMVALLAVIILVCPYYSETPTLQSVKPRNAMYRIMDIGVLPGYASSTASSINNQRQIVGTASRTHPLSDNFMFEDTCAYIWQNGITKPISSPTPTLSSEGLGINNKGDVVGRFVKYDHPLNSDIPFLYSKGRLMQLKSLGGKHGTAYAINNQRQIVGDSEIVEKDEMRHGTLWKSRQTRDLGALHPRVYSLARGINHKDQIIGESYNRATLWQNGKIIDLGTLGGEQSKANAINDQGQIVGTADTHELRLARPPITHAFLWEKGHMIDLTKSQKGMSAALSINNHEQIVGWVITDLEEQHAALWNSRRMVDLNTLISPDSGWTLIQATGINDYGDIIAYGIKGEMQHALLLKTK